MIAPKTFTLFGGVLAFAAAFVNASGATQEAVGFLALAVFWLAAALWLLIAKMEDHGTTTPAG